MGGLDGRVGGEMGAAAENFGEVANPDSEAMGGVGEGALVAVPGRWYVAAVQPGREDCAERHLARQGFAAFAPRHLRTVRHARRAMTRKVPLFPGYLFVALDLDRDRWRAVNGTFGVRGLVAAGERPSAVPRGLVEGFIKLTDETGVMDAGPALLPGQRVQVLTGPFADLIGTIDRLDGRARVRVLLNLLNGESPVTMDRDALWPAA